MTLAIRMRDGCSFSATVRRHCGEPENPASPEDLGRRFADCTARFLGTAARGAVLDAIADERTSVQRLMALLRAS